MKFQSVKFIKTVVRIEDLPSFYNLPEIGVVGRSNVGKSTLLNHLFGAKNLVKTSSTPGKTRALNFFTVDEKFVFVDLPGYGYAKVPAHEKAQWGRLVETYLSQRSSLKLLLFLVDVRRIPTPEDLQMFAWMQHASIPVILVLTKVDKVKKSERISQTKTITGSFKGVPYVHYSSTKNEGRKQLILHITEYFRCC